VKRELDGEAGQGVGAGTLQEFHVLYTSLAHRKGRKYMARRGEIVVQNAEIVLAPGAGARYKRRVH
jgi:hypothetical protein